MSDGLIQATSQGIAGTYKDGTIKVVITIEPTEAAQAFEIFGVPGAPLVIGRLTQEAAQASMQEQAASAGTGRQAAAGDSKEQKGGELAKWAGILCADEAFTRWIDLEVEDAWEYCTDGSVEDDNKYFIYKKCGIQSRRELDHNKQAGLIFREEIMKPFHQWKEKQK